MNDGKVKKNPLLPPSIDWSGHGDVTDRQIYVPLRVPAPEDAFPYSDSHLFHAGIEDRQIPAIGRL